MKKLTVIRIALWSIVGFAAAVMRCLPTSVCLLIGGAAFGFTKGIALAWIGALLGTAGAWGLARSRLGAPLQRAFAHHPLLRRLSFSALFGALFGALRLRVVALLCRLTLTAHGRWSLR